MLQKYLDKLEYIEILNQLQTYCMTFLGKELALSLIPSSHYHEVNTMLNETTQASNLLFRKGSLPLGEIFDIRVEIKSLESSLTLSAHSLLNIAHILKIARELHTYFYSDPDFPTADFPELLSYFEQIYVNPTVEKQILDVIIDQETISDNASPALSKLRKNRKNAEQEIRDKLNSYIHSGSHSKYLMDPIITIRNDRYVIPIKAEYKDQVSGFIHDISSSGSTFFIEPMTIFELNNKVSSLKIEEEIEIERILTTLSGLLFPLTEFLKQDLSILGSLDFIFAKAKYSNHIHGIHPTINEHKKIEFIQARHPLIDPTKVVPIDVTLGKDFFSLIITGPNTGGKTVSLKTVGLLIAMACSGLHIPTNEKSSIYVFDHIFADIGDEQSIQESLSTFSSHMLNIVEILNLATSNSLILLDELGSGTDPIEGASLAISILEHFYEQGSLTIATTHYPEIKNYALVTDGFENASSDFDVEHLTPTYKLLIGIPGKSNAFAISKRLGLSEEILVRAKDFLKEDSVSIEELLKNIYDDKLIIEKEKETIQKNANQIELLRKTLERDNSELENKTSEMIEKAKNQAREILLDAKEEANDLIKELNTLLENQHTDSLKTANQLRNHLNASIKNSTSLKEFSSDASQTANAILIGSLVRVNTIGQEGIVQTSPNKSNEVQVQIGSMTMNVPIKNITVISHSAKKKQENPYAKMRTNNFKSTHISTEINVIGQNVEEATMLIDKYLDDCSMSNLETIRIVHGKGTGKLRQGIHQFLRTNPHVKSYRLGTFGEGEMGVTVVELK